MVDQNEKSNLTNVLLVSLKKKNKCFVGIKKTHEYNIMTLLYY